MLLFTLLTQLVFAADPAPNLVFEVQRLTSDTGQVMCTLYADKTSWLQDPGYLATVTAKPSGLKATCTFPVIPPGEYAISFIHDENGNGDMDTHFFGLPAEPWGMSLDAPVRFGPPSFESAKFTHPSAKPLIAHAR